ncbi:MAG: dihydrodipicolinate synthase family protein [Lachnospiraceae bacterium]|nr:dihydrodipicolinate synthase family protein [Lachnospiraceae bacterium]
MKAGFIPAVGTPLDTEGNLCVESYKKQIDDQIQAGAIGILSMGSMGQQAFIRGSVYPQVARAAVEAAAGRVPVYVGAMDCSIGRARERMDSVESLNLDIAGFVFTTPYYHSCSRDQMVNYFTAVGAAARRPVLLYDLPGVTQSKITCDLVLELIRKIPNLTGIKSNDTHMFRRLKLCGEAPESFALIYSGLDIFDVAYKWGIDVSLDGMLGCTPMNTGKLFASMKRGDFDRAALYLNHILELRDFFAARDLWASYSAAMNMLGYEGNHAPDYVSPVQEQYIPEIRREMERIGEL